MPQTQPVPHASPSISPLSRRYAALTSDWTFKRVFADGKRDTRLVFLINTLLKKQLQDRVVHARITQTVELGISPENRGAVFDLQCVDTKGRYFILEMQFGKQSDFIKRAHFGISLRYAAQAEKGATHDKAFNIPAIYHLSFLDFELDFGKGCDDPVQYISLHNDEHPEVVYDIIHMAFVQLPKFLKTAPECKTSLEKLIFLIKNADKLNEQPENFKGKVFDGIFHLAEISRFTEKER
jgi:predicted transposase/invertase (TIGR01784 family)